MHVGLAFPVFQHMHLRRVIDSAAGSSRRAELVAAISTTTQPSGLPQHAGMRAAKAKWDVTIQHT
jgi:hypothetical protein